MICGIWDASQALLGSSKDGAARRPPQCAPSGAQNPSLKSLRVRFAIGTAVPPHGPGPRDESLGQHRDVSTRPASRACHCTATSPRWVTPARCVFASRPGHVAPRRCLSCCRLHDGAFWFGRRHQRGGKHRSEQVWLPRFKSGSGRWALTPTSRNGIEIASIDATAPRGKCHCSVSLLPLPHLPGSPRSLSLPCACRATPAHVRGDGERTRQEAVCLCACRPCGLVCLSVVALVVWSVVLLSSVGCRS